MMAGSSNGQSKLMPTSAYRGVPEKKEDSKPEKLLEL